ncbi:MAG: ABC transporter substrate-binding protein [Parvibaculaceae bacterium]
MTVATLPMLGAQTGPSWAQDQNRLRFLWWGGENRAKRTLQAVDVYKAQNAGVSIDPESMGWDDYWARLATQVAGGNPPDVVQMDYQYIFEYARRGALAPLDEFRPDPLDIEDFGETTLGAGTVDGKLYGVTFGVNSDCFIYDKAVLEKLGLPAPALTWTWKEYADLAVEITKGSPEGFYGSSDPGAGSRATQTWMRQRGKELYGDKKLGCSEEDIAEWFAFVDDLRKRKGCVPAEVQALDPGESITESMLTLGKSAMITAGSNQHVAFQAAVKNPLGMTMHPHGDAGMKHGQWIGPSMLLSITPSAANKKLCAHFINFLVESKDAANVLKVERGVPPSARMRDYLSSTLDPVEKVAIDYVSAIGDKVGPLPPPPPSGANEVEALLIRTNAQIGFGEVGVADAAKEFFAAANKMLDRK